MSDSLAATSPADPTVPTTGTWQATALAILGAGIVALGFVEGALSRSWSFGFVLAPAAAVAAWAASACFALRIGQVAISGVLAVALAVGLWGWHVDKLVVDARIGVPAAATLVGALAGFGVARLLPPPRHLQPLACGLVAFALANIIAFLVARWDGEVLMDSFVFLIACVPAGAIAGWLVPCRTDYWMAMTVGTSTVMYALSTGNDEARKAGWGIAIMCGLAAFIGFWLQRRFVPRRTATSSALPEARQRVADD